MIASSELITAAIIFFARVCDVSLGTFRQAMIVRGKRAYAFMLAFVEALIWVYAVSRVIAGISGPLTAFSFALGFASGTFVGITIEGFFKIGEQVLRVFTKMGDVLAAALREKGYRVTEMEGKGRDGAVSILFIQTKRRDTDKIAAIARALDPLCYLVFDDIRGSSSAGAFRK